MSFKRFSEVPNQNFSLIKRNVQSNCRHGKRLSDADLFVDPSFPPDLTSLTYVYTGDDRYEKMVFKRPLVSLLHIYLKRFKPHYCNMY